MVGQIHRQYKTKNEQVEKEDTVFTNDAKLQSTPHKQKEDLQSFSVHCTSTCVPRVCKLSIQTTDPDKYFDT